MTSPLVNLDGVQPGALCLIWAQDRNRAIGKANALPWHSPADLKHFRQITKGCPVVMGRRTYQSLPPAFRPLPGRLNLVVSHEPQPFDVPPHMQGCHTLYAGLRAARQHVVVSAPAAPVFVIGGQALFEHALRYFDVSHLFVTELDVAVEQADRFVAPVPAEFRLCQQTDWQQESVEAGTQSLRFLRYDREVAQ